ncbi:Ser/Thr protein kinase RdoA involved in Cpx stress response, MazF antagonist [Geosporobacter subterraneus DSM 17957]|uniref:Ser/Thr protein kinase RdoA involved in Cpx stress response, MazF antagonist n=1 Tax=Geosporobacter subterraneus DSM 17957 TaxID=1121919 RepID=A0A1M6L6N7_9FIRM|nr:phosphotransferase [Geosporobacter subterraneus]SHJ66883.1 Ser/Thr protein kinase RdoA involved in Cpx stress response, MazF antagonist [Geosporobacter subterraneus DSM 17957]
MVEISEQGKIILDSCSLSAEDINYVCEQFNIGKLKSIHKRFENTANINLMFETEAGKFVLKLLHTEPERLNSIIKVMKILHMNHVPVILPLQDINDEYYVSMKNLRVQLTPFVDAGKFSFEQRQAVSSGRILKKMHMTLANFQEIVKPAGSIYPSRKILNEGIARLIELGDSIPREQVMLIKDLHDKITGLWSSQSPGLPNTIIHGDWNERNQLFDGRGRVRCILDFDFAQRRERLFDVAYVLWNFLIHADFQPFAKPFMKGYGRLTEQERKLLQVEIARVSCFFICTASFSRNPSLQIDRQLKQQVPFINYILSDDGEKKIKEVCGFF